MFADAALTTLDRTAFARSPTVKAHARTAANRAQVFALAVGAKDGPAAFATVCLLFPMTTVALHRRRNSREGRRCLQQGSLGRGRMRRQASLDAREFLVDVVKGRRVVHSWCVLEAIVLALRCSTLVTRHSVITSQHVREVFQRRELRRDGLVLCRDRMHDCDATFVFLRRGCCRVDHRCARVRVCVCMRCVKQCV